MAKKTRLTRNFTDQNLECPHLLFNYPSKESLKPKFVFRDQNTQKHPEQPSTQTRSSKPISVGDGNHPGEGGAACGQICHSFAGGQALAAHVGQMRGNALIFPISANF